jgi:hypothetical protein
MESKPILKLVDVASTVQQGNLTLVMKATGYRTNSHNHQNGRQVTKSGGQFGTAKDEQNASAVVVAVKFGLIPTLSDLHSRRYFLKLKAANINN